MIRVVRTDSDRIDIELSGQLEAGDMQEALEELVRQSAGMQNGRMLYRVQEFDLPTLGAIWVEMKHLPQLFRLIGRFDRAALLVGEGWVQKASAIEGAFVPGLEIKAFGLQEEAAAEAWLAR